MYKNKNNNNFPVEIKKKLKKRNIYSKNTCETGRRPKVWVLNSVRSCSQTSRHHVQPSWRLVALNQPSLKQVKDRSVLALCIAAHASPSWFQFARMLWQATSSVPARPTHVFVNIVGDGVLCCPGYGLERKKQEPLLCDHQEARSVLACLGWGAFWIADGENAGQRARACDKRCSSASVSSSSSFVSSKVKLTSPEHGDNPQDSISECESR